MSLTDKYHKLILKEKTFLQKLDFLNFLPKQNEMWWIDEFLEVHETLSLIHKEKESLSKQYDERELSTNFGHYAITIGCNNNDLNELSTRVERFTGSSYCKETIIEYAYEADSETFLHVHMLVQLTSKRNEIRRSAEIRKRYGQQLDGTKANFDIRFLKTKLDIQKWLLYIKKTATKEFSHIANPKGTPLSGITDNSIK